MSREHSMVTPCLQEPPGLGTAPVRHLDGERLGPRPPGQVPPATSLRSGCVVPCGRRLDFDSSPLPGGGWNRCSIVGCQCHALVLAGESFSPFAPRNMRPKGGRMFSVWVGPAPPPTLTRRLRLLDAHEADHDRLGHVQRQEEDVDALGRGHHPTVAVCPPPSGCSQLACVR